MFKLGNVENELAAAMGSALLKKQAAAEGQINNESLNAVDHLSKAAECLDDGGFVSEANSVLVMLESLATRITKQEQKVSKNAIASVNKAVDDEINFADLFNSSKKKL